MNLQKLLFFILANDVVESGVHNSFVDFDIIKNEKNVKWVKLTNKVNPYIQLVRKGTLFFNLILLCLTFDLFFRKCSTQLR